MTDQNPLALFQEKDWLHVVIKIKVSVSWRTWNNVLWLPKLPFYWKEEDLPAPHQFYWFQTSIIYSSDPTFQYHPGFGWDTVNFLPSLCMVLCFGFTTRIVQITDALVVAEQCLCKIKDSGASYSTLAARRRLELHKKLGGDRTLAQKAALKFSSTISHAIRTNPAGHHSSYRNA